MGQNLVSHSDDVAERLKACVRASDVIRRASHVFKSFDEFSDWVQVASRGKPLEACIDRGIQYIEELFTGFDELMPWVQDIEIEEAPADLPVWEYEDPDEAERRLWSGEEEPPEDTEEDRREKLASYMRSERLFTTAAYMAFTPLGERSEYGFRNNFVDLPVRWLYEACHPDILPLTDGYLNGLRELHRLGVEADWFRDLRLSLREPIWVDVFDAWEAHLWPDYAALTLDASLAYSIPFAASLQKLGIPSDYVVAAGLSAEGTVNRRPNDLLQFLKNATDSGVPSEYASATWKEGASEPDAHS